MTSSQHIQHLLDLSQQLIDLAVAGSDAAHDDGCLLLFGLAQDCAWKLRRAALKELHAHEQVARRRSLSVTAACRCGATI